MINTTSNAFQKLKDRARRRRFISNQIKNGFAFQVRALRKGRVMTQQELASEAETTQALISRIEKNGAASLNVKTLQKIADAFDVALVVRLEPIDKLITWVDDLSPEAMAPRPSAKILAEMEAEASRPLRDVASFARSLQAAASTTAANIQTTLVFDRPQAIPAGESVPVVPAATSALALTGNLDINDRAAA